jgi:hypothetical protein
VSPRRLVQLVAVLAGCGLAAAVTFTKPFTVSADLVTAVPLAAMLAAQIVLYLRPENPADPPPHHRGRRGAAGYLAWILLFACIAAFEISTYLESPRSAHPTFSSLSDELSSHRLGKPILFVAWLALGWLFLFASSRRPSPEQ